MTEREKLIRAIEMALATSRSRVSPGLQERKDAKRALLAIEASRAAIVPIEPTIEMEKAAVAAIAADVRKHGDVRGWIGVTAYKALLSANPYSLDTRPGT